VRLHTRQFYPTPSKIPWKKEFALSISVIKPSFIDLPAGQMRIWEQGAGPTLLVLPGLVNSPQAVCAQVFEKLPNYRVVALELPGLGVSPASGGRTVHDIAATVDAVARHLNDIAGCIAFDLAVAVACGTALSGKLDDRLVLVDVARARWIAQNKPRCEDFALDHDGAYLYRLWNHVRDMDMLESVEPRRPRGEGAYKSAEALDETFLSFAVQPQEYGELWAHLANAIHEWDADKTPNGATEIESILNADTACFAMQSLTFESPSVPVGTVHGIKRGYEDISTGSMHYRTAGAGESRVVALLAGAFSSALLNPLLQNLSANHLVVAPDYIGQGDSCRAPEETTIARAAADIDELTRKLGWTQYSVYGTQTGAGVALEAAIAFPDRVKSVIIDSCSMQYASERAVHRVKYFPSISPDIWGSHVFQVWNILKDGEVFWPWYLPVSTSAKESTSTGLARLHDSVICTLRSRTTPVYKSMSSYEARSRIAKVHQPALFVTGPKDIFKSYMPEARTLAPENFTFLDVPATVWAAKADAENIEKTCAIYDAFFQENN
jgi:pimeloyl-ACP methyl ester carboxylesterase